MALGIPIPYVAAQLLWINLVTNGLQDMALAFELGEKDVIKRKPRKLKEGIMSRLRSVFRINPFSNPFLFYSMVAALLAQIAVVYIPALQWVFWTEPLTGADWIQIGLVALTVVLVVEVDKLIRRRRGQMYHVTKNLIQGG